MDNKRLAELKKKYYDAIQQFCLMDDTFMRVVLQHKECTEFLLRVILQRDLEVYEIQTERGVDNLKGRSAILDVWARGTDGRVYNIEIQNDDRGAVPQRARYHSSLIDCYELNKNEAWKELPEAYVIFITKNDVLRGNKPIYHIDRCIEEMGGALFEDNSHIVYVNSSIQDETELGRLMHDLYCRRAEDMHDSPLAEVVYRYKNDDKGVSSMCEIMEELTNKAKSEGIIIGITEGKLEGKLETLTNSLKSLMASMNISLDKAMELLNVSAEDRVTCAKLING